MHIPPDWGIFCALIVSFLVFWFIFGRLFFGPFLKLIADREQRLSELSERTQRLLRDEKTAREARENQLAAVRREALMHRDSERRRAEGEAARMIEEARAEAKAHLDQVQEAAAREFEAAGRELERMAEALAVELAARVLGRPVANASVPLNN